jgi:hypothetical protein
MGGAVWRHKPEVAHVDSEERSAVLDLERLDQPPLILEGSAAVIWQLIDGVRDLDVLSVDVARYFGESADAVRPAVEAFLTDLSERGLLVQAT